MKRLVALAVVALLVGCGSDSTKVSTTEDRSGTARFAAPGGTDASRLRATSQVLRRRLERLGAEDATVAIDGDGVVVAGASERELAVIATPGRLTFQPVLAQVPPGGTASGVVPDIDGVSGYQLGPTAIEGDAVESSEAQRIAGNWTVALVLTASGIGAFNAIASDCYSTAPACPTGQLAIVLDGRAQSAPTIQAAEFKRDQITISGNFTEREAKDLAAVLATGSLPVALTRQGS